MAIATATEVFDFMQTNDEERSPGATTLLTNLISRVTTMIEDYIGRKIEATEETTIKIHDGRYCDIRGNQLFLNNIYYDIVSITSITEDGTTLVEETDYILTDPNIIERIDGFWSNTDQLNIVIVGKFGFVQDADTPNQSIKQILIEAVSAMSGMWSKILSDGEGNTFGVQRGSLTTFTKDKLKRYIQPTIL